MTPRRNANALPHRSKLHLNSNGRPRVCTGNARRPRGLSPAASRLKNPLTQGRGTIPSEPVGILSRSPDGFANFARPTRCTARTGQRPGEGGMRERPARGAGIGGAAQFRGWWRVRQSLAQRASREAPAAGKCLMLAGGMEPIAVSAILQCISARPGVGHGAGVGEGGNPRQAPAPGGAAGFRGGWGTAVFDGATRNEARWRSLLWGDEG
jgi:hypothetical protein